MIKNKQEVAIGYIPAWMGEEHGFQRTGLWRDMFKAVLFFMAH